jgi:hypothetical protein
MVNWYFSPVLVYCAKRNLATLCCAGSFQNLVEEESGATIFVQVRNAERQSVEIQIVGLRM